MTTTTTSPRRLVIGISGSSAPQYGIALLGALRTEHSVETHVDISPPKTSPSWPTSPTTTGRLPQACAPSTGRRPCIPLNLVHLRNLVAVTEAGATVLPPTPDLVNQTVGKVLDPFGIEHDLFRHWEAPEPPVRAVPR
jgi:3-polyprenyl-4-hydroxybenzoate decarboxylase